jgi:D-mannonate dehydratase
MGLLTQASVAIDGSKFKAVNNRDKNFTRAKMERRMAQIEESVARYLEQLDTADRQEPSEALQTKTNRLKEKIETLKQQMRRLERLKVEIACHPGPADIADRSRCPLDGHQRPRFRRRRLQRSDCRRGQPSSDRYA